MYACIRTFNCFAGTERGGINTIQPDYMLAYAIAVLAHLPSFESHTDVAMLERLKTALWFVMEPLMMKNDAAFVYGFYKKLIEQLKLHVLASDPTNEALNKVSSFMLQLSLAKVSDITDESTKINDI